jgi:hypothetical protein
MRSKIKIWADGPRGGIELDGEDISKTVRGLDVSLRVGSIPEVSLDLLVFELEAEAGKTRVHIVPAVRDLLIAAGWQPPKGDDL